MPRLLLSVTLLLGLTTWAEAATITATDCLAASVQTAINAASAGDTVAIPAGTCSWTTPVSWTAPANVILQGAGNATVGGGDQTIIVDNYTTNHPLLAITINSSGTFRLTGITFQGGTGVIKDAGVIELGGTNSATRIDHNHFNMATYSASGYVQIKTFGWITGVMDHNICDGGNSIRECINIEMESYGGGVFGDVSWATATGFGTGDFFFLEDNIFNGGFYIDDCSDGGKVVVRHNTLNHTSAQTHPTGSGPRFRGCRATEVYLNAINGNPACDGGPGFSNCVGLAFWLSNGPSLVWGNTLPVLNAGAGSGYQFLISLHSMRIDNSTYNQTATPNGWGYCGTAFNGTGSNWDQNTSATTGYACLDQPGRGIGDLLSGDYPNVLNAATGCSASQSCAWPRQALEPVYEWLNSITPVPNNPGGIINNASPQVEAQNRDYYLYMASFTGATGVGSGLLSGRPATCTPLTAYWATDTTTLYQCASTNTWNAYYTPYTYPHPLAAGITPALQLQGGSLQLCGSALCLR